MKTNAEMDAEANYFAMCLLMPEDLLRREVQKLQPLDFSDDRKIKKLADKFKVPQACMLIRLGQIGFLK